MAETGTALAVVEEQQSIVGGALVGASGSAVLAENTDSQSQILEQIRDIQIQTLRATRDVVNSIQEMLGLEELRDRRLKEGKTEEDKENLGPDEEPQKVEIEPPEGEGESGGKGIFGSILAAFGGMAFFKKLFAPVIAIFGKKGLLVRLFGKFGPLGALILGFTLVYKYSDEIAAALAPAIDKIKEIIPKLEPLITFLKDVGDFLIKQLLEGVGGALTLVVTAVEGVIDGFKLIFEGDVMGGLNRMFGMEEGLLGFLTDLPKKIFDKTVEFLGGLAEAMGIDFKALYDNIALYVSDTIAEIKQFFIDLGTNIYNFFNDAYNTVKTTITNAIQGVFNFIGDIFNSISDFMSESYTKAKNFVTSLPDKILGFISNMFSPIIDFFNAIGNRIKMTINGVIDALPLPGFVKDKIKFDVEPSQEQLDAETEKFEKLEAPQVDDDTINAGTSFKLEKGVLQEPGGDGPALYPELESASRVSNILNTATGTEDFSPISTDKGFLVGKADQMIMPEGVTKLEEIQSAGNQKDMSDIESVGAETKPIIIQKGGDTNAASVQQKTDVHSGKLDTGIDSYFDRVAFNARGF